MKKVEDLLRGGKSTALEVLQQLALDELDEGVAALKRHKHTDEVCSALMTLIAAAPLEKFAVLSEIYRKHCR
ncbi:MAG TPA: hypothetical protein VKC64_05525 [Burkholderiales bacterium]|nr:hypothetical protein [Burkholderiales bacterium]